MKNTNIENKLIIKSIKLVSIIRIAIMFIVAILSFGYSGVIPSALALLFTTMLFALQIIFSYKYISENEITSHKLSRYSYIPAIIFFIMFAAFNLFIKRDILYTLIISLSLSVILLPRNKSYYTMISYLIHKGKYVYSQAINSCSDILQCNKLVFNADKLFTKSKVLDSMSTVYSHYDYSKGIPNVEGDYAVDILKEFTSVFDIELKNFKFNSSDKQSEYDFYQPPQGNNGLTYAVLNNKNSYRLIVYGDFDLVTKKCNGYADKNSLSDLSENRGELLNSMDKNSNECSRIISFAFCDLDEFTSVDLVDNMIYIGSLMVKNELSEFAYSLLEDISTYDYSTKIICDNDNLKDVERLINSYNFKYIVDNTDVYISNTVFDDSEAAHLHDEILLKNSQFSKKNETIFFGKLRNNAKSIMDNAVSMENKINILSYSVIITFLLATMLIPNNVMHPYILVTLLCIIEIISIFTVDNYEKSTKSAIINAFVIALSALSVFFAGRFLVDAQLCEFDKESVGIARTMLVFFYILLSALYDSLTIFTEPKKHVNNIIMIFICIILVFVLNSTLISKYLLFKHLEFEAVKFVVLFVAIPILVNIVLTTFNNRKGIKNG